MKIPVIRTEQKGVTLYIGKIRAEDLLDIGVITEWDPNLGWDLDMQGYQRAPIRKHYMSIAGFLTSDSDPLMPTSALLSAREGEDGILQYEPLSKATNNDFGFITIPDDRHIYIVDYQHRLRGLQEAIKTSGAEKLRNFQIPFVLMSDAKRFEEIKQFYLINNKQKRVDTDLALALMQTMAGEAGEAEMSNLVGPGNRYKIRASRLTFKIAARTTGVWVNKIQEPNNPRPGDVVSVKSFVDSLKLIISSRSLVHQRTDDELIEYISNYWLGISSVVPILFQDPTSYSIQKAVGVFVMHRIAARKVFPICTQSNDFSPSHVSTILRPAVGEYLNELFWKTGGPVRAFSSGSGQAALADNIIKLL
ncbi:MAG: DGQHR domain-containing protein [Chloroflexi bacterium]|nr:DGQHR domain-containing protein [Chloroflexota bacterium]